MQELIYNTRSISSLFLHSFNGSTFCLHSLLQQLNKNDDTQSTNSVIYSCNECCSRALYVLGTILGTGNTEKNKTDLCLSGVQSVRVGGA